MIEDVLGDLRREERSYSIVSVAYKTVDAFGGIVGRPLFLRDSGDEDPSSDGVAIFAPFRDAYFYQYVEHQLAHILFKSDGAAADVFVQEYSDQLVGAALALGVTVDKKTIGALVRLFVDGLEDHRVVGLWGRIYEGSAVVQRAIAWEAARGVSGPVATNLRELWVPLAAGVKLGPGPLDIFLPAMEEALRMVEGRSFDATLITAKWLLTQLVTRIIEEAQANTSKSDDASDAPAPSSNKWRASGLEEVSRISGMPGTKVKRYGDFRARPNSSPENKALATLHARNAIVTNVKDSGQLERALNESRSEMDSLVEKARGGGRSRTQDDWLRRDAPAKIVFRDIRREDIVATAPLTPKEAARAAEEAAKDKETVRRLRAHFFRVMGRKMFALEDSGMEVDVEALIAYRLTRDPRPVFRTEQRSRGFRAMVLIDRSTSMSGRPTAQAERACRVIEQALRFPFVRVETWGFQSTERGVVDITRFPPGLEVFQSAKSGVGGQTPLHIATRLAARRLEDGHEKKHLFVITDGMPVYQVKNGQQVSQSILERQVREDVLLARTRGVGVTGVLLENGHSDGDVDSMRFMFGPQRHWKIMDVDDFGKDLVSLVASSFADYLRNG